MFIDKVSAYPSSSLRHLREYFQLFINLLRAFSRTYSVFFIMMIRNENRKFKKNKSGNSKICFPYFHQQCLPFKKMYWAREKFWYLKNSRTRNTKARLSTVTRSGCLLQGVNRNTNTLTYTYSYTYAYVYVQTYVYKRLCMHIFVRTYMHIYICTHIRTLTYAHAH